MAIEIERKFLLKNDDWKSLVTQTHIIKQGYLQSGLSENEKSSVRIRISDQQANINIKSADQAMLRQEYEYPIPVHDAEQMLSTLCDAVIIEKTRYHVVYESKSASNSVSHLWEIDVFENQNKGLQIAEIELSHVDETFDIPDWIGKEVTDDKRYYNNYLLIKPYNRW
jgi:adenylate cyclase